MSDFDSDRQQKLRDHEAGVADLIAAYESVEAPYFAAVIATTPVVQRMYASNSSSWVPNADMG